MLIHVVIRRHDSGRAAGAVPMRGCVEQVARLEADRPQDRVGAIRVTVQDRALLAFRDRQRGPPIVMRGAAGLPARADALRESR
jgi:hypothetical protein